MQTCPQRSIVYRNLFRIRRPTSTVTGGAEWRLASGVSLLAKFDGEFANRSQTYSRTGRIRYTWRDVGSGYREPASRTLAQQPRQIFFSRAFISASSSLIESTYFAASAFPASGFAATARGAGFAAADDLAVEAILS